MRILVVEDEAPARDLLIRAILAAEDAAEIVGELESVGATLSWLKRNPEPDLLVLDIQLADGHSFEIFERATVRCPVIFATAFDSFLLEAFRSNGIDYLLKPIRSERVADALAKYRRLKDHFTPDLRLLLERFPALPQQTRTRFLVRKGAELQSVPVSEAAYFLASGKLNFLVTLEGVRYPIDHSLSDLERELPRAEFFRLNRGLLARAASIARIHPYGKGRLLITLRPPCGLECVVSQEKAQAFRLWLDS